MSEDNQEVLVELYEEVRGALSKKLRQARLAPKTNKVESGSDSGIPDFIVVTGFEDQDFVDRFGAFLQKVEDADIAALTLYLSPQESLVMLLGKLVTHIGTAPEGKTGLPYLDEWQPSDDALPAQSQVFWSHSDQDEPRQLLEQGYRIAKSKRSADGSPGEFVSILVAGEQC